IFGSMFQLVKSKEARRADGEHYTSETNILKVIEPLFLDGLRKEANRLIGNRSTSVKALREFRDSLADMAFCDPACGCGNFLVVAYRELRKIETDIIVAIRQREGLSDFSLDASWEQKLSIGQFYGFELNWWPAKIAETAMFLVDHQANRELALRIGNAPERLPITITGHIRHGNALRIAWDVEIKRVTGATYIFGNPPFVGQRHRDAAKKKELQEVWGAEFDGYLDYVTGWHGKSLQFFDNRQGEFAFVTTNSVVQGRLVAGLFKPIYRRGWTIKFAHRTFAWYSEAPGTEAVHCVIVGFTRDRELKPHLWDYPDVHGQAVEIPVGREINAYLTDAPNVLVEKRSNPLSPVVPSVIYGSEPREGGHLMVTRDQLPQVEADPVAAKYIRPFVAASELITNKKRWCLWLEDMEPGDVGKSQELKSRLDAVRKMRIQAKQAATYKAAATPHLFVSIRQPRATYLAIPIHVSESRRYYLADRFGPE